MEGRTLMVRILQCFIQITLLASLSLYAHAEDLHRKAEQLAISGDISGMADIYHQILENNPTDIKARLGFATAQSWQGNHREAQVHFNRVLKSQPDNLPALIGLGYDFAWSKQFGAAEILFVRALKTAPDNMGAKKGLAFTYLWSGRSETALEMFNALEKKSPGDAEIHAAKGQAYLALDNTQAAERAFQDALKFEPGRPDAIDGLATIKQNKRTADISFWVGDTSSGGSSGLRELIVGYWLNDDTRLWARYDNSLSLDNPALVRSGKKAETYYVGLQKFISKQWQTNLSLGTRDLPTTGADQIIYSAEAVKFIQQNVVKFGVELSQSNAFTDKLVFGSYGFPANDRWRIEPTLYLSSTGAADDSEWRAVLFGEYHAPTRWSIGIGAGTGHISSSIAGADGTVTTANVIYSRAVSRKNKFNLSLRYEDTPSSSHTTALIGFSVQLP